MCGVIVVDAESIGLLVSDVMPICMIIALDIVMTLRGAINCSTVICSPTVILAILREASSEHYGPQGLLHTIFSAIHFLLRCTFRLQISLCKQSWRDWQPLWSVGCKLVCVCAGTLDLTRPSFWIDTLVLKLREILTAPVLHHPFLFKGKTNASPISINVSIYDAVVWEVAEGFLAPLSGKDFSCRSS